MSDIELPGLIVPIEARIDRLEKSLAKANGSHRRFSSDIERRSKQSAERVAQSYDKAGASAAGAFKQIAIPFAAGFGLATLTEGVKGFVKALPQIVHGMAEVGDAAKRAGMSAKDFQEWKFVAEQNRIGVDSLTDGFKELSLRADEFIVTGKGSAAEAFARIGYNATDLKAKLKDPSKLLLEIIGRLQKLDKAAQIRVADEIFGGTGGERFVELIAQGEAGLRKTIERAHEVGAVMDDDMIAKAAELDRKFGELSTRMDSFFKNAAISAAEFFGIIRTYQETMPFDYKITFSVAGQETADTLAALPEVSENARAAIESVVVEYADLSEEARRLVSALTDGSTMMNGLGNTDAGAALTALSLKVQQAVQDFEAGTLTGDDLRAKLEEIGAETNTTISAFSDLDKARLSGITDAVAGLLDWIGQIPGKVAEAVAAVNDAEGLQIGGGGTSGTEPGKRSSVVPQSPLAPNTSPRPKPAPALLGETDTSTPSKGGGGGGGDEYARAAASIRNETAALEAEAVALIAAAAGGDRYGDAVAFAHEKAKLLVEAQRAGKEITPALTAEIDQLAGAYVTAGLKAEDAAAKLQKIQDAGKQAGETLAGVFTDVLTGATTAGDALKNLLVQMLQVQLQKQIMGMITGAPAGGFLSFIGGLLGFAQGGYTGQGGTLEPAGIVHRGEYVFSKRAVNRIGAGSLDRLHSESLKGYSGGGLVDGAKIMQRASGGLPMESGAVPQGVTINAPVTVNASGGTVAQNDDLAKQIGREMEATMRGVVIDELRRQSRPGNMMNPARR
ncbi:MAG: phage tail tape measure protein [Rhodobacteraceae bacterium]|nr:phage tail tape measure protein [Paracoccaceae bacterium]